MQLLSSSVIHLYLLLYIQILLKRFNVTNFSYDTANVILCLYDIMLLILRDRDLFIPLYVHVQQQQRCIIYDLHHYYFAQQLVK